MQVFILLITISTIIVLYLLTSVIDKKNIFLKAEPIRKKICPICPSRQYCNINTNYKCVNR